MKFFLLLWFVASVQGLVDNLEDLDLEEYFSDMFPYEVEYDELNDDPARPKRDPLSIFLTVHNQDLCDLCGKGKDINPSWRRPRTRSEILVKTCKCKKTSPQTEISNDLKEQQHQEVHVVIEEHCGISDIPEKPSKICPKVLHTQENSLKKLPTSESLIKPSVKQEKSPELSHKPVNPPASVPPKDSVKETSPHFEYSPPNLSGRFSASDDSMEYMPKTHVSQMDSAELSSGKYAEPSPIFGNEFTSPMATLAAKQWASNPFGHSTSHHTKELPHKQPTYDAHVPIQSPYTSEIAKDSNVINKELGITTKRESQYDLDRNYGLSEYEQKKLNRRTVLNYLKSKYYIRVPRKHKTHHRKKE